MVIGCVRAVEACYQDNLTTLDFLNRLDILSDPNALPKECIPVEQCKCLLHVSMDLLSYLLLTYNHVCYFYL